MLFIAAPAAAAPVTRYVDTTGDDTANDCTASGSPCKTIQWALNQTSAGDEVIVAAGTYDINSQLIPNTSVYLHGELSGARPLIRGPGSSLLITQPDTTVRHLAFEASGTNFGTSGGAIESDAGNVLLDDIDVTIDNAGNAVSLSAVTAYVQTGTVTLSNSTVSANSNVNLPTVWAERGQLVIRNTSISRLASSSQQAAALGAGLGPSPAPTIDAQNVTITTTDSPCLTLFPDSGPSSLIRDVTMTQDAPGAGTSIYPCATIERTSTLQNVTVNAPESQISGAPVGGIGSSIPAVGVGLNNQASSANVLLKNLTVNTRGIGLGTGPVSGLQVRGGRFTGRYAGIQIYGATGVVSDAFTTGTGADSYGISATNGSSIKLRNLTAIGTGSRQAIYATDNGTDITVKNTIARGTGTGEDLATDNAATMVVGFSNYVDSALLNGTGGAIIDTGGHQTGDPLFANPLLFDYHVPINSPVVDAGTTDPDLGTTDIDGDPRIQDKAPDIGADERPAPPPPPPPPPPPDGGGGGGGSTPTTETTPTTTTSTTTTTGTQNIPGPVVTISAAAVKVTKTGVANIRIGCPATAAGACTGTLTVQTAAPVSIAAKKKIVKLGSRTFTLGAGKQAFVGVKLNKQGLKLLKKLKRLRTKAIADVHDSNGAARITQRLLSLKLR